MARERREGEEVLVREDKAWDWMLGESVIL